MAATIYAAACIVNTPAWVLSKYTPAHNHHMKTKEKKPRKIPPTEVGKNLLRLMDRAGVNEYQLAKSINEDVKKNQGTINRILNGVTRDPHVETLRKLAKLLNATLCDFYADQRRAEDIEDLASILAAQKPRARKAAIASAYASLESLGVTIKDDQQSSQGPPPNADAA